jgi:hypothetical protein
MIPYISSLFFLACILYNRWWKEQNKKEKISSFFHDLCVRHLQHKFLGEECNWNHVYDNLFQVLLGSKTYLASVANIDEYDL